MGNKIKITNIESFLLDNVLKQVKERKKKKKLALRLRLMPVLPELDLVCSPRPLMPEAAASVTIFTAAFR